MILDPPCILFIKAKQVLPYSDANLFSPLYSEQRGHGDTVPYVGRFILPCFAGLLEIVFEDPF